MDPIRVHENSIIVEGHHRFISMKLCGMNAPRQPGSYPLGFSRKEYAYPIKNIAIRE